MPAGVQLRITATSFLLPGDAAWDELARTHTLDFGTFGDWPGALLSSSGTALLWVVVLEDLVTPEAVEGSPEFAELLHPLLTVLKKRLENAPEAHTAVAWLAWRPDSPIRSVRTQRFWKRLGEALATSLRQMAALHPSLLLLDLDELFARPGMDACLDPRNWYAVRCRFSRRGIAETARATAALLSRAAAAPRKLMVLDCDNTLWGGIVGEVGLAGLALGQDGVGRAFSDFQRSIRRLTHEGLLLSLCSKNNEVDVWKVFDEHPSMVLRRSDIIAWRINWRNKADNVMELAHDLDLGLDAVVFVDDNPLEREQMRRYLPQVLTPEMPVEVFAWPWLIDALNDAATFQVTTEDRRKTEQYRSRSGFLAQRGSARDEIEFLRTIELQPDAVSISAGTVSRAAQLCAKTNQFNLRTIRHTEGALLELASRPGTCAFLMQLSDRFGDHGLTGLAIAVSSESQKSAFLDTFLLSCRVLGRHAEAWMLQTLVTSLRAKGVEWLIAEFRETGRNSVARDFLAGHGFVRLCDIPEKPRQLLCREAKGFWAAGEAFAARLDSIVVPYMELFHYARTAAD